MLLKNARIVLRDEVVSGALAIDAGCIAAIDPGGASAPGVDFEGDYLLPGVVDMHTDNLEKHFFPRPSIDWDPVSAAVTHDGVCLSVGITTVYDSLSIGSFGGQEARSNENYSRLVGGLQAARDAGMLCADHRLHWRCELPSDVLREEFNHFIGHPMSGLVSLMDHTPGQRQYMNLEFFLDRNWRRQKTEAEITAQLAAQHERQARNVAPNRAYVCEVARARGLPVAAHDDETEAHVDDAADAGATIAEFPVTEVAVKRSRARGMSVIMGGPNLIRGGSYSGNLSAAGAIAFGGLDGFASDYVPRSLIECAFRLTADDFGWSLPAAVATVSTVPARALGLHDRGEIRAGLRADVVRVRLMGGLPVVRGVWVAGQRVA